ncbi:smalltalk protein [Bacteroides stercorirosoris]|nr:smalltalk protein [Bacteroides stercorirosoris]
MKKSVWKKILKVVMVIVSAALGALGGGAMK